LEQQGLGNIENHNASLARHFLEGLKPGYKVLAPLECLSNIVCVTPPGREALSLKQELKRKGIDVSVREGALRVAFHFFNTHEHVDELLKNLP